MEDRRRYRFRIWHPGQKQLLPVISMTRGGIVAQDDDNTITCPRDSVVLMQYSGLADSNHHEIYEGDVVESQQDNYEVRFADGGFRLHPLLPGRGSEQPLDEDVVTKNQLRVIGNIHQPDLYLES